MPQTTLTQFDVHVDYCAELTAQLAACPVDYVTELGFALLALVRC